MNHAETVGKQSLSVYGLSVGIAIWIIPAKTKHMNSNREDHSDIVAWLMLTYVESSLGAGTSSSWPGSWPMIVYKVITFVAKLPRTNVLALFLGSGHRNKIFKRSSGGSCRQYRYFQETKALHSAVQRQSPVIFMADAFRSSIAA
jgi:hypothetical protein